MEMNMERTTKKIRREYSITREKTEGKTYCRLGSTDFL